MNKKYLLKLGAPILALSLIAACGTADDNNDNGPVEDEAPLNQDENNGDLNNNDEPGLDNGTDNGNGNGTENGTNGLDNGTNNGTDNGMNKDDNNQDVPNDDLNKDKDNQ